MRAAPANCGRLVVWCSNASEILVRAAVRGTICWRETAERWMASPAWRDLVSGADPVAKARAIEERVLAPKRAAFARLQAEDPAAAVFLRDVAAVFGRPSAVRIEFTDGTVFSTGRWENER